MRKIKKHRATTFSAKAYGALRPQQNWRFHISSDTLNADVVNLWLFMQSTTLLRAESWSISAAFNTAPRYNMVTDVYDRVSESEVDTFKVGNLHANPEFRSLNGNGWLYDSLIDIFLCAYVQNKVNGEHCFAKHFFDLLWYANEEVEHGSYADFGPRGIPPDTPERRKKASRQARCWKGTNFGRYKL